MHIVLYKGSFVYGVVNYFTDELHKSFSEIGHQCTILDLNNISIDDIINK